MVICPNQVFVLPDRQFRVDPPPAWFRNRRFEIDPPLHCPAILSVPSWLATWSVSLVVVAVLRADAQQVVRTEESSMAFLP